MNNKIFLMATVFVSILLLGCTQNAGAQNQGRTVFTVADAAADMGAVTSVKVTVDSLQVQNASNGWISVSTSPYTYDLLQLKASKSLSLLADAKLEAGTYGQVRMHISKVIITDSSGEHEAKLPSNDLKIVGGFVVTPNSTTAVNFDFLADKSVHVTGNGKYILAPVVRMQAREDAEVNANSRESVKVNGGRLKTDIEVGMDINGNVGEGRRIRTDLNLSINTGTIISIGEIAILPQPIGAQPPAAQPPQQVSPTQPNLGAQLCPNLNGSELVDCTYNRSVEQKDVTVCNAIESQEGRFSCIAQWCGSSARDFLQCNNLVDADNKMGCLNKCNPNSNT